MATAAAEKKVEKVMVEVAATEKPVVKQVTAEEAGTAGLSPQEIEMGKKSGMFADKPEEKPVEKEKEKPETDQAAEEVTEEEAGEEEGEAAPEPKEKPATPAAKKAAEEEAFEDPAKEFELVKTYNPNEKALYFKQKKERLKRQAAERERDFLRTQNEALRREAAKKTSAKDPNAELEKDLEGLDDDGDEEATDKDKPVTVGDLEAREKAKQEADKKSREAARQIAERIELQNEEGRAKHDDFDEVMDLAQEVMSKDKHGIYAVKLSLLAADPDGDVAEYAYSLGKLHPNYGKHRKTKKEEAPAAGAAKTNVSKIVDNAQKRTSSAALGGGSEKGRLVSEDELTMSDVAGMSQSAWDKLSEKTRNRLMRS